MYQIRTWTQKLAVLHELFRLHLHVRTHPNKSQLRLLNSGFTYNHSVQNLLFSHLQSKTTNTKIKRKKTQIVVLYVNVINVSV